MSDVFRMEIPIAVKTKKNGMVITKNRRTGKPGLRQNKASDANAAALKILIQAAVKKGLKHNETLFGDASVKVDIKIYHSKGSEICVVEVQKIADKPKGRNGRTKDTSNQDAQLLDCMQGIVYDDDCQAADTRIRRYVDGVLV